MYKLDEMYNKDFFERLTPDTMKMKEWFVDILMDEFNPKSVIDIGCGIGQYVDEFDKRGVSVCGLEGSREVKDYLVCRPHLVGGMDLREQIDFTDSPINYDLAICIEVAEHIEEEYADIFLDNLIGFSDNIIMTSAPPGQGGDGHVNLQPQEYWIDKMNKRGYMYKVAKTKILKQEIQKKKDEGEFVAFWFIPNIMVFEFKRK